MTVIIIRTVRRGYRERLLLIWVRSLLVQVGRWSFFHSSSFLIFPDGRCCCCCCWWFAGNNQGPLNLWSFSSSFFSSSILYAGPTHQCQRPHIIMIWSRSEEDDDDDDDYSPYSFLFFSFFFMKMKKENMGTLFKIIFKYSMRWRCGYKLHTVDLFVCYVCSFYFIIKFLSAGVVTTYSQFAFCGLQSIVCIWYEQYIVDCAPVFSFSPPWREEKKKRSWAIKIPRIFVPFFIFEMTTLK